MATLLNTFPLLHTERLDLVEITHAHVSEMFRLFTNKEVIKYYNVKPFPEEADVLPVIDMLTQKFVAKTGIRWGIVLKEQSEIIGNIGFNNFTVGQAGSISYALLPEYWGRGLLTEALREVIQFGFDELGVGRIEAEVMPGNVASERVLLKNGFHHKGFFKDGFLWNGRHFDVNMYTLVNSAK